MLVRMGRDEMRAADADREVVAEQLRTALNEGRLDLHEYDERLQQVYAARTYGELRPLVHDLPVGRVPDPVPGTATTTASDRELTMRWLAAVWGSWASVVGITTVIWVLTCLGNRELLYFWPMWVAGPWGAVLVWSSIAGVAAGAPRRDAEKKARKRADRQAKRERRALEADGTAQAGPAQPADSAEPAGQAGQAGHPGQAGQAGHPGQAGQAGHPGQAGQAGQEAHPGQTAQAGQAGYVGETPAISATRDGEAAPVWNPEPRTERERTRDNRA
ncbi:DUF1707 domain-containing protein [Actinoplanes sp. NPDC051494]|uniref:DUF1707 domain-containing protein n=1 Tax=Actinoplanes sp. NPDC051494 TaxID=3363907 RepID=UPI0037AD861C